MKKTLLAALLTIFGLSACSSLDGKSPGEMVKIANERSLTKDYSYNFNGEVRAFLSDKDKGVAPAISAEAQAKRVSEAGKKEPASIEKKQSDSGAKHANELKVEGGGLGETITDSIQKYPSAAAYLNDSRLFINGAVDLRAKKIEIIPELQIKARNEFSNTKMPILLDGNDMSISVDTPASIPMVLNFIVHDPVIRARLVNQSIRFSWADVEDKTIPLKSALKAAVKSAYTAYNSIPADQFRLEEMDEFGKRAGARYRISLVWSKENEEAYYQAFGKEFNEELTRLETAGRDEGSTPEGYDKVRKFFESIKDSILSESATESWTGSPLIESIYLDRKGRRVGTRNYMQINGTEKALNVDMSIAMNRFGRPVFTYQQPKISETVSLKELMDAYKASSSGKGEIGIGGKIDSDKAHATKKSAKKKTVTKKAVGK